MGDARETDSRGAREVNIGQLIRERFGLRNTFNIGFTTHTGTVTAADSWDKDPDLKRIRPSLDESFENLLHQAFNDDGMFYLLFRSNDPSVQLSKDLHTALHHKRLERAIGVIYRPRTERQSHYFDAHLSTQFDCVIHIDVTRALRPLEIHPKWTDDSNVDVPDTYPMNV